MAIFEPTAVEESVRPFATGIFFGAGDAFTRDFAAGFTFALRAEDFFGGATARFAAGFAEREAAVLAFTGAFAFLKAFRGAATFFGADFFAGLKGRFAAFAFTAFFDFAIRILTPLGKFNPRSWQIEKL